jgi:ABC-2 type transport system ATP-binding protein
MNLNKEKGMTVFLTTHYIEEAEKMANHVAIIEKGKIITNASVAEIITQTKTSSLEEAFLSLTGKQIRIEESTSLDRMRRRRNLRH